MFVILLLLKFINYKLFDSISFKNVKLRKLLCDRFNIRKLGLKRGNVNGN
jgi:hypothetical protein